MEAYVEAIRQQWRDRLREEEEEEEESITIGILHSILDFEHSRNQRQCYEFSSPIGFDMGRCISKV